MLRLSRDELRRTWFLWTALVVAATAGGERDAVAIVLEVIVEGLSKLAQENTGYAEVRPRLRHSA